MAKERADFASWAINHIFVGFGLLDVGPGWGFAMFPASGGGGHLVEFWPGHFCDGVKDFGKVGNGREAAIFGREGSKLLFGAV
jgi:hypothetical protein